MEKTNEKICPVVKDDASMKTRVPLDSLAELSESRACYERGEYEDFDDALEEIRKEYGI